MKENGEKACWVAVYDSVSASYAEEAGVFPAPEHKYKISGDTAEFEKLFDEMSPLSK